MFPPNSYSHHNDSLNESNNPSFCSIITHLFYFSPQIVIQIYYMMIPHCICTWCNKNIRQNRRQLSSTFILSLIQKDSQILSTKYFKFYSLQVSTITTLSNLKQREYHFLSGWIPLLVHTFLSILSHSI